MSGSDAEQCAGLPRQTLTYAHQGCFLALPDIGFYADTPPFVDLAAVERDAALLENEIEGAAALGCMGFVQLISAVDDFVAYEWLGHPEREMRRARAEALAAIQRRLVERAHGLGLEYYVQTYELLLDRWGASSPENHDWFLTGVASAKFPARKRWLRDETLAQYVDKLAHGQTDPAPDGPAWCMETWNGR